MEKKKRKLKSGAVKILKNILSIVLVLITVIFLISLKNLNVLPDKYFNLVLIAEIVIMLLGIVLYNLKNKAVSIIGIILMILLLVANSFGIYYVNTTKKFIKKGFSDTIKTSKEYYVITSKNNSSKLSHGSKVNYYKYSENIDEAEKKLGNYNYTEITDLYTKMTEILLSNEYILVDKNNYKSAFEIVNTLKEDNYKIVKKIKIEKEEKKNNEVVDSYNIYIGGRDFTGSLMDFNMLLTVNNNSKKVLVTSIPRDYYMNVHGYGMKDSLEFMGLLGDGVNERSLEDLLGIKINYSAHIYTQNLVDVVDKIGGVEFCSDRAFTTTHALVVNTYNDSKGKKLYIKKGCQTLNGIEALTVSRERLAVGSDRQRQANCRQLALNIAKKVISTSTLSNYSSVLNSFNGLYTTDMNEKVATNLLKNIISNGGYTVEEQSLDGSDSSGMIRLGTVRNYIMQPYAESVTNNASKINEVLNEK